MLTIYTSSKRVTYKYPTSKKVVLQGIDVLFKQNVDYSDVSIANIKQEYSMRGHDTISLNCNTPNYEEIRDKFNKEHTHYDFEMRLFTKGTATFYIHHVGSVYEILVTSGDLISIPANMRHWFDAGDTPDFTAVRFFKFNDGWIPEYTGSDIAERYKKET